MTTLGAEREAYQEVLAVARRLGRSEADARDLAQDVMEIAFVRGMSDWWTLERRAWLRGVVRRRAAFLARGETRRRRRESLTELGGERDGAWSWEPSFLAALPRSLRAVAKLVSAELGATEIRWLLELTDTALRQRLTGLRRALRALEERPTLPAPVPRSFGAQRAQVLTQLKRRGGRVIATQDPDGHVLFLRMDAHGMASCGNR